VKRNRRYYVIFESSRQRPNGEWKVKLENGPVISTHGSDYNGAVDRAQELGYNNQRPVMVNYKDGKTGADYYSVDDLNRKFGKNSFSDSVY